MSLRTRLLLSYLILLGVTLGVIFGALLLIISRQPEPASQRYRELFPLLRTFNITELTSIFRPRSSLMPTLRNNNLDDLSDELNVRLILLRDAGNGQYFVEYDTEGVYPDPDHFLELFTDAEYYSQELRLIPDFVAPIKTGSFKDPNSQEWLFISVQPLNSNYSLVMSVTNTGRTLQSALAGFGSALGTPLLQSAVVGLVVALLLAAFTSRAFTGTLQKVALAATAVAEGDYQQTLPLEGPAEIRAVADAFNHMTEEVQKNQQAQRDFLANITHDLKTPLTSIQGYSQAITDGTAKDAVKAATIINDEAARMARLVNDLTELSRLHSGAATLRIAMEDVNQIVSAVSQRLAVVAQRKGITVQTDFQPLPPIPADGDRLAQVFTNLIGNALTFTPSQGTVTLVTRKIDEPVPGVSITVQDSGIGIPPAEIGRIFERFYQVDKARGPKRGTGLGLAITREIVTAHHGDISVTSAGENQGTTFTVTLPLNQHEHTTT
jgi:signal transduction histidine kinase